MGSVYPLRRAGVMGRHFVGQVRQVGQVGQIWCAAVIQRSPQSPQKVGRLQTEPCGVQAVTVGIPAVACCRYGAPLVRIGTDKYG